MFRDCGVSGYVAFELFIKQGEIENNYGWIMSQDDGGYDRSILMHDNGFAPSGETYGLALGMGAAYTDKYDYILMNVIVVHNEYSLCSVQSNPCKSSTEKFQRQFFLGARYSIMKITKTLSRFKWIIAFQIMTRH